jgi:radical SAM superfamily enzyme with C-terminal helix-hairpin-helix motif
MPAGNGSMAVTDVFVVDHGPRSLTVLPYPLRVRDASLAQWRAIPGFGSKRAARVKAAESLRNSEDLAKAVDSQIPEWLVHSLSFNRE